MPCGVVRASLPVSTAANITRFFGSSGVDLPAKVHHSLAPYPRNDVGAMKLQAGRYNNFDCMMSIS